METHKFRLRLNLFDAIVLIAALVLGAAVILLGLRARGGEAASPAASTVQYTVLFQKMVAGAGENIQPGDPLEDAIKNYQLGTVVSVDIQPAVVQVLNQETRSYVDAQLEGYEDVYVTVRSTCTDNDEALLLGGGYDFRVGQLAYVKGPGYMGSGPVTAIERSAEQ